MTKIKQHDSFLEDEFGGPSEDDACPWVDENIKTKELDPKKEYVIIVGKGSKFSKEDAMRSKMKNITWVFVEDVNQIKPFEVEEFNKYMESNIEANRA